MSKQGFSGGSKGKESACNAGDLVRSQGWEDPLQKEMATHSSILAWRSPWTKEPGRLQSMGLQRAGHDSATKPQPLTDTTTWMNLWRIMLSEKKPILYTIISI